MGKRWREGAGHHQTVAEEKVRQSVWLKSQVLFFFFWRSSEISAGASWCGLAKKLMFPASAFLQTWIRDYEISVFCYFTFQKPTKHCKFNLVEKPRQRPSLFIDSLELFLELVWCYLLRTDSLLIVHLCFALGLKFHLVKICHLNMFWPQGQIDEFIYSRWWSFLTVVNRIN